MRLKLSLQLLILIAVFTITEAFSNPIDLSKAPSVTGQKTCFHGKFSSYDTWLGSLSSQRKIAFQKRGIKNYSAQLAKFETNFKNMFPKRDFDSALATLDCELFTYQVNGKEVLGVLVLPKQLSTKTSDTPLVLYNRGGTRNYGQLVFGHIAHELVPIAKQGFAVIASDYRKDEEYGADNINEVVKLLEIAKTIAPLNSDKVHVYGISRGGMTSMQLARLKPERIASIVSISGVSNSELWAQNREGIRHNISLIKGFDQQPDFIHRALSPVKWVDELPDVPILMIHSEDDDKVSVEHTLQMAKKLKEINRDYETVIFSNGGHSLTGHKKDALRKTIDWFESVQN